MAAAGRGLPGTWKWRGAGTYVEEGDLPSEKVDKLGVLRPLSLPWVGLGGRVHTGRKARGEGIGQKNEADLQSDIFSIFTQQCR